MGGRFFYLFTRQGGNGSYPPQEKQNRIVPARDEPAFLIIRRSLVLI
jgi:hypothetical protein